MEKALSKKVINLYGLPSFGFQMFVNVEVMLFAAFLTDYIKLPVALATTVLMITSIFDILWVPTAGIILEKSNMKWGKYRSWLLVGPVMAAIFYTFQFMQIGDPTTNAITITIGFLVSHLIWNTYYAAHIAMNNALTTVREERIAMASNRGMLNALGALMFSYFGVKAVMAVGTAVNDPALGFTYVVIAVGILMILSNWIYFYITKDYAFHGTQTKAGKPEKKMSVGEMLKQIVINPPLIGLLLVELGRYLGRFIIFGMAFYYFKYVINDLPGLAVFMMGLTIVNFFAAMIAAPVAKKIGEKNAYTIAILLLIAGLLAVWAIPMEASMFKIVMFIAYIGYGLPDSLGVAMYSATVDYAEWKTGKNARGFIMSLISFPIKTAVFVRSIIIGAVLASAGYVADMAATPGLIQGIKNGFSLYPSIIIAVGLGIMTLMYSLTPKKLDEIHQDIAKTKQKEI
ncbi:MAG: MFS transporter [Eubacteriaceae bacterium]|nr:MFS transporter [Eubacteriaceae bacterium]